MTRHTPYLMLVIAFNLAALAPPVRSSTPEVTAVGISVTRSLDSCPDIPDLVEATRDHLESIELKPQTRAPRIEISFARHDGGYTASLHFVGGPGFTGSRLIDNPVRRCSDLAAPIALVVAVVLDDARRRHALSPPTRVREDAAARGPRRSLEPPPATPPPSASAQPWRISLGPAVSAALGAAPAPSFGLGGLLRLERADLAVVAGLGAALSAPGGAATSSLQLAAAEASLHACWSPGVVDLCAGVAGGVGYLYADALVSTGGSSLVARLSTSVRTGIHLDLQSATFMAGIELGVPLVRARASGPTGTLWTAPAAFGSLMVALLFKL